MSKTKSNSKIRLAYCISKLEKKQLAGLLLVLCFFMHTTEITPTIRYVSKTGSSTPPYTSWETAADSIQKCINISEFGDTIYVANGVYKEQVVMIRGLSLIGSDWDSTIVDARGLLNPGFAAITFNDSCYLSGFRIIISGPELIGNGVTVFSTINGSTGIIEKNRFEFGITGISIGNHKIIVSDNIFINTSYGIGLDDINYSILTDNIINPEGVGIRSGVGARPIILNNIITLKNYNSKGIDCTFSYGTRIKNNLIISSNSNKGIETYAWDTLANNTVYGYFSYAGIISYGRDYTVNNSITNGGIGYRKNSGSTGTPVFKYNNIWGNNQNYINYLPDSTNISFDPMFVNTDSMDFKLQMFSPLIDAGDPNILDVDGSRSDIGLYGGPYGMSYQYIDLPPRPPQNVMAVLDTADITIKWNPNTEADFNHYKLFRDTTANFIADSTTFVMRLTDTSYNHIIPSGINNYYYKLTAVDNQRNESLPSEEIAVNISSMTINDYPITINDYILYQNYPNPFNPSTIIGYKLREPSYVKLRVYDINGQLVNVLVNQLQEAGYYEVQFNAAGIQHPEPGSQALSSGIYLYKIDVINENRIPVFSEIKKMLLLK